eukprot:7311014-Alexandrium_andersonii.AAC.1
MSASLVGSEMCIRDRTWTDRQTDCQTDVDRQTWADRQTDVDRQTDMDRQTWADRLADRLTD